MLVACMSTRLHTLPASAASGVTTLPGGSAAKGLVALPVTGAVGAAVLAALAGALAVGFAVGVGAVGFAGGLGVLGADAAVGAGVFAAGVLGGAVCSSSSKCNYLDRQNSFDTGIWTIPASDTSFKHPSRKPLDLHAPARGATGTAAERGDTVRNMFAGICTEISAAQSPQLSMQLASMPMTTHLDVALELMPGACNIAGAIWL